MNLTKCSIIFKTKSRLSNKINKKILAINWLEEVCTDKIISDCQAIRLNYHKSFSLQTSRIYKTRKVFLSINLGEKFCGKFLGRSDLLLNQDKNADCKLFILGNLINGTNVWYQSIKLFSTENKLFSTENKLFSTENKLFQQKINYFQLKINYFQLKINYFQLKINYFQLKINYFQLKINYFQLQINYFHLQMNYFHPQMNYFHLQMNYFQM